MSTVRDKGSSVLSNITEPLSVDCRVQPWMCFLLPQCDGKLSVRELLEFCKQNSFVDPETPLAEFAKLLLVFVAGGFLEMEEFKLPRRAAGSGQKEESNSEFNGA